MTRKRYSRKFQRMAVERMKSSENVDDLAQELGVTRRWLYKWRTKLDLVEPGEEWARPNTHEASYRKQTQQRKRWRCTNSGKRAAVGNINSSATTAGNHLTPNLSGCSFCRRSAWDEVYE